MKQFEREEGYELQLVMAMVIGCQWDGAMLVLKSQQPVMYFVLNQLKTTVIVKANLTLL